ncbi:hypothetical protein AYI68_g7440, partial [Smittium mucronatum]
MDYLFKD